MKYLLINSIKGLKRKKIQMLGIIFMVLLSTGIYTTMSLALDRLEHKYYDYLEEQNVEYFSVEVGISYSEDVTLEDIEYLLNNQLNDLTEEENKTINQYKEFLKGNIERSIKLISDVQDIFIKYKANLYINSKILDNIDLDFDYEYQVNKILKVDDIYTSVIAYDNQEINKAYLIEGELPVNNDEITILPKFAEIYDIKIGDYYTIDNNEYKVVGYAYAPNYIYPIISISSPIFDEEKNNVIYANEVTYNKISGTESTSYSILFNDTTRKFEDIFTSDDGYSALLEDEHIYISNDSGTRLLRISALQLEFAADRLFAEYFLYLLLGISVFIIGIITKKRIEDERLQIGVLKSLGYKRRSIALSYLTYPIVGSIIGGLLGYIVGLILHYPLTNLYASFYLVPLSNFNIDIMYLVKCICVPVVFLSLLSYLISFIMLRKNPLDLLREGSNLKVNIFSKLINKLTSKMPFKYKFKYSLAFRSIPKLIIVSLTSFFTGLLIVLTLIGMNLITSAIDQTFSSYSFDYQISMKGISTEEFDDTADYIFAYNANIENMYNKDNKELKVEEDYNLTLMGIDTDIKYMEVNSDKVSENNISVSSYMEDIYGLKIGDKILLNIYDVEYEFIVTDIFEDYTQPSAYIDRIYLSNIFGLDYPVYNIVLTNNDVFSNTEEIDQTILNQIGDVISLKDLKDNITTQMENYSSSIYIVIAFASLMALIIIGVIANIVVEENKKTISLMKVLGYENKKISSIVLNIYTPIIIISYLLSVPVMVKILEHIISSISGDIGISIPITISYGKIAVGLLGLLIAYYIAIYLSKKVLNKIPLAIALKRE